MNPECPFCLSRNTNIFFPNIPIFTHGHCHDCGKNFPVSDDEIEEELQLRDALYEDDLYGGDVDDEPY